MNCTNFVEATSIIRMMGLVAVCIAAAATPEVHKMFSEMLAGCPHIVKYCDEFLAHNCYPLECIYLTCNKDECFDVGSGPITDIQLIVNLSRPKLFNPTIFTKSFQPGPL